MAISYDMVCEILVRIKDVATLFRCATVCKEWRSLVSFLRRCLQEEDASPFAGFVTQQRCHGRPLAPCFVPAPRPFLWAGRPLLSSFFAHLPAAYFDYAAPLISRHGLLLVHLDLRRAGIDPDSSGDLLAVCDLLAGTVHELPRLKHCCNFDLYYYDVSGYALLTTADCSSSNNHDKSGRNITVSTCAGTNNGDNDTHKGSRFFKVLIVTIQKSPVHYTLHTFSSADESGWKTCSDVVRNKGMGISAILRQHNAIVRGSVAQWLLWGKTGTYTLDVSAKTGHVSCTNMVDIELNDFLHCIYDEPYLTLDNTGKLMVLILGKDRHKLEIWTSHDNERSFQASVLMLKQPGQYMNETNLVYICLREKYNMMLMRDNHRRVYIADLKTGVMQEVTNWPRSTGLSRRKAVPLEMDWSGFFASRLAIST